MLSQGEANGDRTRSKQLKKSNGAFAKERTRCKQACEYVPIYSFGKFRAVRNARVRFGREVPNETLGTFFMLVYSVFALFRTNVRFRSVRLDLGMLSWCCLLPVRTLSERIRCLRKERKKEKIFI